MGRRRVQPPPHIEGARPLELIGSGGFADVYLYQQLSPERKVAVKVMREGVDAAAYSTFEAEAALMAKLSGHPAIVSLYDVGRAKDLRPYLVMEYCPPPHLGARVQRRPLSLDRSLQVGVTIAGAVETVHRANIIHRDIKPANILLTAYGHPVLTDFGISTALDAQEGLQGAASLPWAPPEQVGGGGSLGVASDVYSLAATVYTLLVGHSPFQVPGEKDRFALHNRVLNDPVRPTGRADVPAELERIFSTAMSKKPQDRYPSALSFARALQQVQRDLMITTTRIDILGEDPIWANNADEDDESTVLRSPLVIDAVSIPSGNTFTNVPQRTEQATLYARSVPEVMPVVDEADKATVVKPLTTVNVAMKVTSGRGVSPDLQGELGAGTHAGGRVEGPSISGQSTLLAPTQSQEKRRSTVVSAVAVVMALALFAVLGVVGYYALLRGKDKFFRDDVAGKSPRPISIVEAADPVEKLVGKIEGDKAIFTWNNPSPKPGDSYIWRVVDVEKPRDAKGTKETTVTVPLERGRVCIEVSLRRSGGESSEPVSKCVGS